MRLEQVTLATPLATGSSPRAMRFAKFAGQVDYDARGAYGMSVYAGDLGLLNEGTTGPGRGLRPQRTARRPSSS